MKYLFIFLCLVGLGVGFYSREKKTKSNELAEKRLVTRSSSSTALFLPKSLDRSSIKKSSSSWTPSKVDFSKEWKGFLKKFGSDFRGEFGRSGELTSIQSLGSKRKGIENFDPKDSRIVLARAQEILKAVQAMTGFQTDWPLENTSTRGSFLSAQVFLNEMHEGIKISPVGSVRVDIGSNGELVSFYSNYVSNIFVSNQIVLDLSAAQQKVVDVVQKRTGEIAQVEGGQKVIWVEGKKGRISYQFLTRGREFIVDAQDGKIIYSRDHRIYD